MEEFAAEHFNEPLKPAKKSRFSKLEEVQGNFNRIKLDQQKQSINVAHDLNNNEQSSEVVRHIHHKKLSHVKAADMHQTPLSSKSDHFLSISEATSSSNLGGLVKHKRKNLLNVNNKRVLRVINTSDDKIDTFKVPSRSVLSLKQLKTRCIEFNDEKDEEIVEPLNRPARFPLWSLLEKRKSFMKLQSYVIPDGESTNECICSVK